MYGRTKSNRFQSFLPNLTQRIINNNNNNNNNNISTSRTTNNIQFKPNKANSQFNSTFYQTQYICNINNTEINKDSINPIPCISVSTNIDINGNIKNNDIENVFINVKYKTQIFDVYQVFTWQILLIRILYFHADLMNYGRFMIIFVKDFYKLIINI